MYYILNICLGKGNRAVVRVLHVQDLICSATAAQAVAARPPADRGVEQRRQEDVERQRLSDQPCQRVVHLRITQRPALEYRV